MKANNSNKQPKTDLSLVLTVSFNKNKPLGHKKKKLYLDKGYILQVCASGPIFDTPHKRLGLNNEVREQELSADHLNVHQPFRLRVPLGNQSNKCLIAPISLFTRAQFLSLVLTADSV